MTQSTALPAAPREFPMLVNGQSRIASDSKWIDRTSPVVICPAFMLKASAFTEASRPKDLNTI